MTTRAEHFIKFGGRWRNARIAHRCDRLINTPMGSYRCDHRIEASDLFLDTNVTKHPHADEWDTRRKYTTLRYCFSCANGLMDRLTDKEVPGKIVTR